MSSMQMKHHRDLSLCKGCKCRRRNRCAYDTSVYARIFVSRAIEAGYKTDKEIENVARKDMRHLPPEDERVTPNKCPYYAEQLVYDCNYEEEP